MSDKTLSISAALREAQLQRLESSLASKAATKPEARVSDVTRGAEADTTNLGLGAQFILRAYSRPEVHSLGRLAARRINTMVPSMIGNRWYDWMGDTGIEPVTISL